MRLFAFGNSKFYIEIKKEGRIMKPIFNWFILLLPIIIIIVIGCTSERGNRLIFDPGENNNNNNGGNTNDYGINIKDANELPDLEQALFELTNQYRANLGLTELAWSNTIAKQCRQHSSNMALGNVPFGHQGLNERFEKIRQNFPNAIGEELIAKHSSSNKLAEKIFDYWLGDAELRQNIERDFQTMGVGSAKNASEIFYFTQIFISQEEIN
jgi:uncharacterized protein YkwD